MQFKKTHQHKIQQAWFGKNYCNIQFSLSLSPVFGNSVIVSTDSYPDTQTEHIVSF